MNDQKIPRQISPDDLANFRYLLNKYGFGANNISVGGTINAGAGFLAGGTAGWTGSFTLAKLTPTGSNGAVSVKDGIIYAVGLPT